MSSRARSDREEERRLSVRTLLIASVASATAAIVTSQFWKGGTPIAAAVTPIIVTIVSELLHRPTEKIAKRMTVERDALPDVTLYRAGPKRQLPVRLIAATAALAIVIGVALLTLPELIAGQSLGEGDRATTIFGGRGDSGDEPAGQPPPAPTQEQQEQTEPAQTESTPEVPSQPDAEEPPPTPEDPPATTPSTPAPEPPAPGSP